MKKSFKKRMIEFFITFAVVYLMIIALMYNYQRNILYFTHIASDEDRRTYVSQYEHVSVETEDGLILKSYFHPPQTKDKPIILLFHGNASTSVWKAYEMEPYVEKGYGVWLAEYRGYDANSGQPTEEGLYRDGVAYLNSERLTKEYAQNPLIVLGESLGSGVASEMVHRYPDRVAGVILKVPFDSLLNVASTRYPFVIGMSHLLKDQYRSIEKVSNWSMPKLFLIAGKDEVVGAKGGKRLFEAAPEPKELVVIDEAHHNDIADFGMSTHVLEFLANIKVPEHDKTSAP